MSISDRYSCQEHGQDKHEDCIACEVYGDIAELVDRISELEIHSELYATRYTEGVKAGMERAAEIADNLHIYDDYNSLEYKCDNQDAAEAIRKEIEK